MRNRSLAFRSLAAAVLLAAAIFLPACLPVGLGDPAKSKADPKYVGAWTWKDGEQTNVVVIRPFDERTYVLDTLTYTGDTSAPVPKQRIVYKGWLADVKGATFLTMQPIHTLVQLPGEETKKTFLVSRLDLAGDQLTATPLNPDYAPLKDVGTPTDLERVVAANFDDAKLWSSPIKAVRLADGKTYKLEDLIKLFENMGK